MNILIFGFGYVAKHWVSSFSGANEVHATSRHKTKFTDIAPLATPHLFGDDLRQEINQSEAIIITAPPSEKGDDTFLTYGELIQRAPKLKWLAYLSTTGVYGDHAGAWVDESTPAAPISPNSKRRAMTESQWLSLFHQHRIPVQIFRIAGIYGPGRSMLDRLSSGKARRIDKPGHVMNRIHVDDICQALTASMEQTIPGEIYNLADDLPASTDEVISYICEKHTIAPPPLEAYDPQTMSPMLQQFYAENKRVKNDKIKQQLGVKLKYPSYKNYY